LLGRRHLPPEEKERRRFYLLPGMGGRAYFRKQRRIRMAAIGVGFGGVGLCGLFALVAEQPTLPALKAVDPALTSTGVARSMLDP